MAALAREFLKQGDGAHLRRVARQRVANVRLSRKRGHGSVRGDEDDEANTNPDGLAYPLLAKRDNAEVARFVADRAVKYQQGQIECLGGALPSREPRRST